MVLKRSASQDPIHPSGLARGRDRELLLMIIFFEDTEIARSILAMIASYSTSLFEVGKSKRMVCSIISLVRT